MLFRASMINGYAIRATDGEIGSVDDLLFDDASWTMRWLVVDTGGWLPGRTVLLPLSVLAGPDPDARIFAVHLTKKQVEESPGLETHLPISRQYESRLYAHYGWEPYWMGMPPLGGFVVPPAETTTVPGERLEVPAEAAGDKPTLEDQHLRSVREVIGYRIAAVDDEIGEADDFLVEDGSWALRYLVVDTGRWLPGRKVLVSPRWIRDLSWSERRVRVDLRREEIEGSPEYDPSMTIDRAYEERLHQHYRLPGYWI